MIIFFFDIGFVALLIFVAIAVLIYGTAVVSVWFAHHMTTILIISAVIMAIKSIAVVVTLHDPDKRFSLTDLVSIPLDFIRGTIVVWFIINIFITLLRTFLLGFWFIIPLGIALLCTEYIPLIGMSFKSMMAAEFIGIAILLVWVVLLCKWPGNDFFYIGNEVFRYLSILPEGICLI